MLSESVESAQLKELARKGTSLTVRVPTADLDRLSACTIQSPSDRTDEDDGINALAADVQFDIGPEDFPRISLSVTGHVSLQCQRCLEPLSWPVSVETRLSVLDSEEQTGLIASPYDSVLTGTDGLDLAVVIEDEILAALPMVPVHSDGLQCRPAGDIDNDSEIESELMQRPFADLARLAGSRKSTAND